MDGAIGALAAVESGGEHEHVLVALEACLDHSGEVTALSAGLVDTYTQWLESWQIEQEVVDEIAEVAIVVTTDDGAQRHAVLTTEGMVGHKGVEPAVVLVGQVLHSLYLEGHIEVLDTSLEPLHSLEMTVVIKELVDLVFVYQPLEPCHEKAGHQTGSLPHLACQNLVYIYGLCHHEVLFHNF